MSGNGLPQGARPRSSFSHTHPDRLEQHRRRAFNILWLDTDGAALQLSMAS